MQIPQAPLSGQNWKSAVLQWIRSMVSYLKCSRVIPDNKTVFGTYTSDGLILSCSAGNEGSHHTNMCYPPYEYNGYMKIVENADGNIEVINGEDPDSDYSGLTDLDAPGLQSGYTLIPRKVFTRDQIGKSAVICLGAYYNADTGYGCELFLKGNIPETMLNAERYVIATEIGTIKDVTYRDGSRMFWIYQTYRGGYFYFARSYLL